MASPIDQFRQNISHVRNLMGIYRGLTSITTRALDCSDLLRAQVVMAVSALDHYIHEITRLKMIEAFRGSKLRTKAFMKFTVSLGGVLSSGSDPTTWFENEIRNRHSYSSFQRSEKISEAVALVKDIDLWKEVGRKLSIKKKDLKRELDLIVDRRNKIAHEADMDPSYPGARWPIREKDVSDLTKFIEDICNTIESIL